MSHSVPSPGFHERALSIPLAQFRTLHSTVVLSAHSLQSLSALGIQLVSELMLRLNLLPLNQHKQSLHSSLIACCTCLTMICVESRRMQCMFTCLLSLLSRSIASIQSICNQSPPAVDDEDEQSFPPSHFFDINTYMDLFSQDASNSILQPQQIPRTLFDSLNLTPTSRLGRWLAQIQSEEQLSTVWSSVTSIIDAPTASLSSTFASWPSLHVPQNLSAELCSDLALSLIAQLAPHDDDLQLLCRSTSPNCLYALMSLCISDVMNPNDWWLVSSDHTRDSAMIAMTRSLESENFDEFHQAFRASSRKQPIPFATDSMQQLRQCWTRFVLDTCIPLQTSEFAAFDSVIGCSIISTPLEQPSSMFAIFDGFDSMPSAQKSLNRINCFIWRQGELIRVDESQRSEAKAAIDRPNQVLCWQDQCIAVGDDNFHLIIDASILMHRIGSHIDRISWSPQRSTIAVASGTRVIILDATPPEEE